MNELLIEKNEKTYINFERMVDHVMIVKVDRTRRNCILRIRKALRANGVATSSRICKRRVVALRTRH